MANLDIEEVNQYIAGNRTRTPKCSVCNDNYCYINVQYEESKRPKASSSSGGIYFHFSSSLTLLPSSPRKEIQYYHYSSTCRYCKPVHHYISDISANEYVESHCKSAPLCAHCKAKPCFIRVEAGGWYFTKSCASCLGSKNF